VLGVDEKRQCWALKREQPMLPMGLREVEGSRTVARSTGPQRCLLRSTDSAGRCSRDVSPVSAIGSSSSSCV